MENVVLEILQGAPGLVFMRQFPALSSNKKMVRRGIELLQRYTPALVHYLSRQRTLSHLARYAIELRIPADLEASGARQILQSWMRRLMVRKLVYVVAEVLLMPLAIVAAILPGPNVAFYLLFVLLYFHFSAFWHLRRIKVSDLRLNIVHSALATAGKE